MVPNSHADTYAGHHTGEGISLDTAKCKGKMQPENLDVISCAISIIH